jgi:uncharacterized protein
MPEDINIKIIQYASKKDLKTLYKDAGWWETSYESDPGFLNHIVKGSAVFAGAFEKNRLIGMGRALSDSASDAYVQDVAVLEEYRGRGIGKRIIKALLSDLKDKGVDWIGLIAKPGTSSFYKGLGFEQLKDHVPMQYKGWTMHESDFLEFKSFALKDRDIIQQFVDTFKPVSCEYNFSNLFCWQKPSKLSWSLYQDRVLIYDDIDQCAFMPLGEKLFPKELAALSESLKNAGYKPDLSLVSIDYIEAFPEIEDFYIVKQERDYAEYIYDINKLCELRGKKLTKKRNLISQFKKLYPAHEVQLLASDERFQQKALLLARDLFAKQENPSDTISQEFEALEQAFRYFKELCLEGIAVLSENKVVAFSVFSFMNSDTYDIQFEKSDISFKGSSQVINHETAKYLQSKCQYLNKEQDLGIEGLRKAKLSYSPEKIAIPYKLIFKKQSCLV